MKHKLNIIIVLTFMMCTLSCRAEVRNLDPVQNAVTHNAMGVMYFQDGDYYSAIQELKLAIQLNPNSAATATIYNNLGLVYLKIKYYKWAKECFEKSIQINPNFISYYQNLIKSHKHSNTLDKLFLKYKNNIDADISYSAGWLMCGLIEKERGNNKLAVRYLRQYAFLEPDLLLTSAVDKIIRILNEAIEEENI